MTSGLGCAPWNRLATRRAKNHTGQLYAVPQQVGWRGLHGTSEQPLNDMNEISMTIDRRSLLKYAGFIPLLAALPREAFAADDAEKADYTLRIATPGSSSFRSDHIVSTTLYNGQFPGPLVRLKEGHRVVVDI